MASFEFLAIIFTGVGLIASLLYYTFTLQNANRTQRLQLEARQTQIFMDLYKTMATKEFMQDLEQILVYWDFEDYDDFYAKYGADVDPGMHASFDSMMEYYNGIGLLAKRGSIDPELVYSLMRFSIFAFWEKYKGVIEEDRKRFNTPNLMNGVEDLYNLLMEYRTKELQDV